jgi:hypothetical protein
MASSKLAASAQQHNDAYLISCSLKAGAKFHKASLSGRIRIVRADAARRLVPATSHGLI